MTKKIEQYYDLLSAVYDSKTPEFKRIPCQETIKIIQNNSIQNLGKVLDIGCGTGQVLDEIRKTNILVTEYFGIDISNKMLEIIKSKYIDISIQKKDVEEGIQDIGIFFDSIIMIGVFEFLGKKEYIINEIYKKINTGGYFIFSFEQKIPDHPIQNESISPMGKIGDKPIHPLTDFSNFRYTLEEISQLLGDKFEIIDSENFVGYYKTQDMIPIYYTIILSKKL